jgi:hypothetical protein
MDEVVRAIRDREMWERITRAALVEVARDPRYSFRAMVDAVDRGLDLSPGAEPPPSLVDFNRMASLSLARLPRARMHALGLPPAVNRLRFFAIRALQAPIPSPIAIPPRSSAAGAATPSLRAAFRYARALAYWAIRPHLIPWGLLLANRRTLPADLSEVGRLQVFGAKAVAAGAGSPFAIVLDREDGEVRIVLRDDVPPTATVVPGVPRDVSWASIVSLHLTDPWLLPVGWEGQQMRRLDGLSAVLGARPKSAVRLLRGRASWCEVAILPSRSSQRAEVRQRRGAADGA